MTVAPAPVREPAWSLPRTAIGLWLTESLISVLITLVIVGALLIWVPADLGGPVPFLRWAVPIALALEALVAVAVRPWL